MYFSVFAQRYRPYIELFARRAGVTVFDDRKEIENQVRARFGFPAIGERWASETLLLRVIETIVSPRRVIHHYRGKELQGLELDIWVPDLRLAVEYQGEQHFKAMKHWSGEEGFAKRQFNDRRKRALCKQLGYELVEFRFDDDLEEVSVRQKLARHLV